MKLTYERLLNQEFKDGETIEVDAKSFQAFAREKEELKTELQKHKKALKELMNAYAVRTIREASKDAQIEYLKSTRIISTTDYRLDLST